MLCRFCNLDVPEDRMRFNRGKSSGLCKDCYNAQRRNLRAQKAKPPKFDEQGNRRCPHCDEFYPISSFQIVKGMPSGWCRKCRTEKEKQRRRDSGASEAKRSVLKDGKKLCCHCGEFKSLDWFSPSSRGLGEVSAYCKPCAASRYRNKDTARKATLKYRERHRERHLANHRVWMFEYRTRKKVTSDGSVTDQFLKKLYATEACYLCGQITPKKLRTADHVIPLARGGTHTADNLKMACWSCNSSKRDLTPQEYKSWIQNEC